MLTSINALYIFVCLFFPVYSCNKWLSWYEEIIKYVKEILVQYRKAFQEKKETMILCLGGETEVLPPFGNYLKCPCILKSSFPKSRYISQKIECKGLLMMKIEMFIKETFIDASLPVTIPFQTYLKLLIEPYLKPLLQNNLT